MYKVLAVAVLCCLALQAAADADRCTSAHVLHTCLPSGGHQQLLARTETVNSLNALNIVSNSTGFLAKCPGFIQFGQCARATWQASGCTVPTDAANTNIIRFRTASEAVNIVCIDKASDFFEARECLSSDAVRQAVTACASANSARNCIEYANDVTCATSAVRAACPGIAGDFFAFASRLLKSSPHTALCVAPAN